MRPCSRILQHSTLLLGFLLIIDVQTYDDRAAMQEYFDKRLRHDNVGKKRQTIILSQHTESHLHAGMSLADKVRVMRLAHTAMSTLRHVDDKDAPLLLRENRESFHHLLRLNKFHVRNGTLYRNRLPGLWKLNLSKLDKAQLWELASRSGVSRRRFLSWGSLEMTAAHTLRIARGQMTAREKLYLLSRQELLKLHHRFGHPVSHLNKTQLADRLLQVGLGVRFKVLGSGAFSSRQRMRLVWPGCSFSMA